MSPAAIPITAAQLRMNCIMASIGLKRTGVPVPATRPLKNARKAERHFHGAAATTAHERTVASTRPFGADRRRRIATRLSNGPLALSWIFLGPFRNNSWIRQHIGECEVDLGSSSDLGAGAVFSEAAVDQRRNPTRVAAVVAHDLKRTRPYSEVRIGVLTKEIHFLRHHFAVARRCAVPVDRPGVQVVE